MKHIMALSSHRNKLRCIGALLLLFLLALLSLVTGRYPIRISEILTGNDMQLRVFTTLRLPRTLTAIMGGFVLGVCGMVFQTVFRNPLASPDMIGVASGASAGAAVGILIGMGAIAITICSFIGAMLSVTVVLLLAAMNQHAQHSSIVLCGVAVHALAQTVLMFLKLNADPQRELAAIEYWIMGSLSGVTLSSVSVQLPIATLCTALLFLFYRQWMMLGNDDEEARLLGLSVTRVRAVILTIASLAVASVVSLTGLISFIGLLAPHIARLLIKRHCPSTVLMSGLAGGSMLCAADLLARSTGQAEMPVSIFTSLIGVPFLLYLLMNRRNRYASR